MKHGHPPPLVPPAPSGPPSSARRPRRPSALRIVLIAAASVVVVAAILGAGLWAWVFSGLDYQPDEENDVTEAPTVTPSPTPEGFDAPTAAPTFPPPHVDGVDNILLLGRDSHAPSQRNGLSDIMIVLTLDRNAKTMKLTTIMRDLWVDIPGYGPNKINAAYSYGGARLAVRTVNEYLDLDIEKYAVVDILGSEKIVDSLGGLTLSLTAEEIPYFNAGVYEADDLFPDTPWVNGIYKPGTYGMNGRQVVAYTRMRKSDSDFQRTQRQRDVLLKLLAEFRNADLATKTTVVKQGVSLVKTNLSPAEITELAFQVLPALDSDVKQFRLPTDGDYAVRQDGGWRMVADRDAMLPKLQEFIWGRTFDFSPLPASGSPAATAGAPTR